MSDMPFQTPRHHSQSLSESSYHDNFYSAANAIQASGQSLAAVGLPVNHWPQKPGSIPAPDQNQTYYPPNANGNGMNIPYRTASQHHNPNAYSLDAHSQYQTPQRGGSIRRNEELHLPQSLSAMSDIQHYGAPPSYNFQPPTPQHPSSATGNPVPGQLQPGQTNRPPMISSSNTAPQLPTLPQITTQMQQPQPPQSARPMTLNQTHSYSRSSPGLMEQTRYKPFSNTPEKYNTPNSYGPQTPSGPPSYSPLGLSDIRSRGDALFSEPLLSPTTQVDSNDVMQYPTNSSYVAPWPIYALDWCKWPPRTNTNSAGKVAIGSYSEDGPNWLQVLDAQASQSESGEPSFEFIKTAEATHAYPVTRILWEPPSSNKQTTDLLATSGDHLRLWSLPTDAAQAYQTSSITGSRERPLQKLSPLALLSNSKSPEHTAPITSLDWNVVQPSLIITSSIDTTCTIWDIPTLTAKTQLIAHDKEVYDVRFCANSVDVFVSCGADGSVRMFDLRSLEHSTIIYEPSEKSDKSCKHPVRTLFRFSTNPDPSAQLSPDPMSSSPTRANQTMAYPPPLLRIAASPHDPHLLSTFSQDSNIIRVLDVRQPGQALLELKGHGAAVSCIEWSNTQRGVLASGADDCCVLIWDLMSAATQPASSLPQHPQQGGQQAAGAGQERGPSAAWECGFEVSNLSWAPSQGTLGVCGGRGFWGVQL